LGEGRIISADSKPKNMLCRETEDVEGKRESRGVKGVTSGEKKQTRRGVFWER